MQASDTNLGQLISREIQYVVPLFQRPYSWSEKQWKTLWADIREQFRHDGDRPHFFGSIVTSQAGSVPEGVGEFLLIDGQQRITTIQILLAAVRDFAGRLGETELRNRINGVYLKNEYRKGNDQLKVLPTQADRAAFNAIMNQEEIPPGRLCQCHQYFSSRLETLNGEELARLHSAIVERLSLVSITCDKLDNPHLIFESLNAKGEKLTPADLIRNYLLMRVQVSEQDRLYKAYWEPIQQALGNSLTEFVRHYLMKEGRILKEADVYFELKDRLANSTPSQTEQFLKDLHRHGLFYANFIIPEREQDPELSARLDRIRLLKVTVAYPFLLRLFDAFDTGSLRREELVQTLDLLESFVLRRLICNRPTNQLRRMLPPVFDAAKVAGPSFVEGVRSQLGGSRCPGDEEFASKLATEPLYSTAEKTQRLTLILKRLERSFNHKERADLTNVQIEHVLPQTLTPQWVQDLGEDDVAQSPRLLHTLGNLTITKYNAELSNKPFSDKQRELVNSHFELNRYFAEVSRWNAEAIELRGRTLAQRALTVWPDVGRAATPQESKKRASIRPIRVRFRDSEQPVRNWKDAFLKLLKQFDLASPGLLLKLAVEEMIPSVVSTDSSRFLYAKARIGDVAINTNASAAVLQEWSRRIAEIAGIPPSDYEFVMPREGSDLSPVTG